MNTSSGHRRRRLRFELLEPRCLLSAGLDELPTPTESVDTSPALLALAKSQTEDQRLTASDGADMFFAYAVSIDGDTAIVGASRDDWAGDGSGSAYVFRLEDGQWVQRQKLTASDASPGDHFGSTVALSGDTAFIGASSNDEAGEDAGAEYVFRFDGDQWVQRQKLTASDARENDRFGSNVALVGGRALIHASNDSDRAFRAGSVYAFEFDGSQWIETQEFTADDVEAGDWFGISPSLSGEVAIMGARRVNEGGAAYIFRHDGTEWVQQQKLLAFNPAEVDVFGIESSISGDFAFVGSDGYRSGDPVYAYVFRYDGTEWVEFQALGPFEKDITSAVVRGDTALIGSHGPAPAIPGSAYLFRFDGSRWVEDAEFAASDATPNQFFGRKLAISGGFAMLGDPSIDNGDGTQGAVYAYKFTQVAGRHVFYNNSAFDGNDPAAGPEDDLAIATDKRALRSCETATFANYTGYSRGINGIMVDILNMSDTPNLDDFDFRVGNDGNNPAYWPAAPQPTSVTVREGAGVGGSDRVTIIWPDGVIKQEWLRVKVLATDRTGLGLNDVFYFGNAIGESGNSTTDAKVNAYDMLGARDNQRSFLDPAPIDFPYDFDRNARVGAVDMLIARNHTTHFQNALQLITPPAGKGNAAVDAAVVESAAKRPRGTGESSPGESGWLYEFDPINTQERSDRRGSSAEEAVGRLLASLLPGDRGRDRRCRRPPAQIRT